MPIMSQYCWEGKDTIKLDNRMGENICKSFVQQGTCIPEHKRTPRQIIQIFKWAKVVNRKFSKEDIQMASKHMKRYSTLLVIRKMHIKTLMRNTPTRTAIVRQSDNNKHQWLAEKWTTHPVGGNVCSMSCLPSSICYFPQHTSSSKILCNVLILVLIYCLHGLPWWLRW